MSKADKPTSVFPPPEPDQPPMAEFELAEKLSKFPTAERSNLQVLYALFVQGQTQKWQEEKLRTCGIIGGKITDDLPLQCSMREFARILTTKFGKEFNKEYHAKEISEWINKKGMPEPGENNLLHTKKCLQWFEDTFENGKGEIGGPSTLAQGEAAKQQRQILALEREHFQLDLEKKKAAGDLVSRREAEIACIGLAKRFLSITRDEIRDAFLKIDIARGEQLIDALDAKYKEAATEAQDVEE